MSDEKEQTKRIIVMFYKDCRLHDNHLLDYCIKQGPKVEIIPIYMFLYWDYEEYNEYWNSMACGAIRKKFYLEAVEEFQHNL